MISHEHMGSHYLKGEQGNLITGQKKIKAKTKKTKNKKNHL